MDKPHIPFVDFPLEKLDLMELMPLIAQATLEIGRYDGTLNSIQNPNVLLSPITNQEAVLSSRIEGTVASLSEILEYDTNHNMDNERVNDFKEVLNYRTALLHAKEAVQERNVSMSLIRELHHMLTEGVRGGDKTPGQVRTTQNLVGKPGDTMETARFIPPSPESLPIALDNFERLLKNQEINELILLTIIHAQFEILHPFNDGNGRLGRMLIPLFLFERKVIQAPAFYMSEFLENNDTEYRDRLLAITENGDWQGWCQFFLGGITKQAKKNNQRANDIIALYETMKVKFAEATQSKHSQTSLDAFFKRPIIRSTDFTVDAKIDSRETANNILRRLREKNLIDVVLEGAGSRPTVYIMKSLIDVAEGR